MHSFTIIILLLCYFRSFGLNMLSCAGQTLEGFSDKVFESPDEVRKNGITFKLYNRNNKEGKEINDNDGGDLFIKGLPLVLVTHGWYQNTLCPSVADIVNAYLEHLDMNIITVDWQKLSIQSQNYFPARYYTLNVGKTVKELVVRLERDNLTTLNSTHLIGHNLGAHVMGTVGFQIQQATGEKVGRITGLDADGPLFEILQLIPYFRLDYTDGEFVEHIHTAITFGYIGPWGHANFFPNGGQLMQPGCNTLTPFPSHGCAPKFFAESIGNKTAFLSTKCSSYTDYLEHKCKGNPTAPMGQWTPKSTRGKFYLTT